MNLAYGFLITFETFPKFPSFTDLYVCVCAICGKWGCMCFPVHVHVEARGCQLLFC